jgi:Uma2 family endonuclease
MAGVAGIVIFCNFVLMPSAVKILPHYTYEDYCNWEGRWEIIDGIPYAMSPAPMPGHQKISNNVKYEFTGSIKKKGCRHCTVYDFLDVKITDDTVVEPDGIVCCREITKNFLDFPPSIVIEVLSPATVMKDRNNKFYLYQSFGVKYYLIVDADKNTVEIYELDAEGKYAQREYSPALPFGFQLDDGCTVDVVLNNIWE